MFIALKTSQHFPKTFPALAVIRCLAGRAILWSILELYTRARSANTREPSANTAAKILRGNARWTNILHCVIVEVGKEWLNQVGGNHNIWSIFVTIKHNMRIVVALYSIKSVLLFYFCVINTNLYQNFKSLINVTIQ